jgi:hypothetical protein
MDIRLHIFDWDDNILHLDTQILIEEYMDGEWAERSVSTQEYASMHENPDMRLPLLNGAPDYKRVFGKFNDSTPDIGKSNFVQDSIEAIDRGQFALSSDAFRSCLINGNIFMICTARGIYPTSIRHVVEYYIDNVLTESERETMMGNLLLYERVFHTVDRGRDLIPVYLDNCDYVGVSSDVFQSTLSADERQRVSVNNTYRSEVAKEIAITRFVNSSASLYERHSDKVTSISIGFSDDDVRNVDAIHDLFNTSMKAEHPHVNFHIYHTQNSTGVITRTTI